MDFTAAANVLASAEGEGVTSPYLIGGFGLAVLIVLLIITLMINVDR
ncbi:MAG: hypothetical protein K9G05_04820 [Candidatus Nanopelagicales bacterium]|nr:hypothetical protein [Candidatus Nanopelagicales bacterium]MCF8539292.1 hypothetical protein [Candidatus Nanopelagicales bacterium]MCF8551386.1 hypothetical protein [Candidatus Nanopelagicales bacterium]